MINTIKGDIDRGLRRNGVQIARVEDRMKLSNSNRDASESKGRPNEVR